MTKLLFLFAALLAGAAHAEVYKCEVAKMNGVAPTKAFSLSFDPGRVLLEINRGNGPETVLGADSIYMIDANAIWFDRNSECKYKRTNFGSGFLHSFDCGSDIKAKVTVQWNHPESGSFESILTSPNMPDEKNSIEFQHCQISH